jgi:hypothetical protein
MPYIVVVKHDSRGTVLILAEINEIKDAQKAIEQARMNNQGPEYDWQRATVGYIPDTWDP